MISREYWVGNSQNGAIVRRGFESPSWLDGHKNTVGNGVVVKKQLWHVK